jgi:uncharacterized membrane protein YdjX (TVP38/TMEM64 family)
MSWKRASVVVAVVVSIGLVLWLFPVAACTVELAEQLRSTGPAGVALFVVAYVVSTVLALPGSALTLVAGFAYGPALGLAIVSPASVIGATCAFLLGRSLLRGWAEGLVARSPRAQAIDAAVGREGFRLVVLLRLSPLIPFNLLNYALSLTNVTVSRYVLASFLGMLPGTALYVYLGSLVPAAAELTSATQGGGIASTALYLAGLAATLGVVVVATRMARRALVDRL